MGFAPKDKERILGNDDLSVITFLINNLTEIEVKIESVLGSNIEKDNPIYDENDYEISLLKTDKNFNLSTSDGYLDFEYAILEKDLKDLIEQYLIHLKNLLINIDIAKEVLFDRVSDNYKNFYRLKSLDIFEKLNTSDHIGDSELQKLSLNSIDNPYKIVLKEYKHFYGIISIMYDNINNDKDIISQAESISVGLPLNTSDFDNLKKWEDNIVISGFSIDHIIKEESNEIKHLVNEVESLFTNLGIKKI